MDIFNFTLDVEEPEEYGLRVEEKVEAHYYEIIDLNTGKPVRFWFGTLAEYNALPEIYDDVCYNIQEASCYVGS